MRSSFRRFTNKIGDILLIDPEGNFNKFWNVVIVMLLIYTATYMPYKLAFISENDTDTSFYIDTIVDFLFISDIYFNFNSPIKKKDETFEFSRKTIASAYLKSWFSVDLLASLPMALI